MTADKKGKKKLGVKISRITKFVHGTKEARRINTDFKRRALGLDNDLLWERTNRACCPMPHIPHVSYFPDDPSVLPLPKYPTWQYTCLVAAWVEREKALHGDKV